MLCLLLGTSARAGVPDGELRVDLRGAIPDILRLQRVTTEGWELIDSAWQQDGGLYHFALPAGGGLYRLVHASHAEPIPLYLDGRSGVLVRSWGGAMLDSARILHGGEDTRGYLTMARARDRYERAMYHLDALGALGISCGAAASEGVRGELAGELRSLEVGLHGRLSRGLAGLCSMMVPCADSAVRAWWPQGVLEHPEWVGAPEVSRRLDDYILSHRSSGFTKAEQDSAYWMAIMRLGALPMGREMAQWLRLQLVYNFSGTDYDALADSVAIRGFGQLRGQGVERGVARHWPSLREERLRTVGGGEVALVDSKAARTLVVFWSVWCGHCQDLLPRLWAWAQRQGGVSVRAVSIDAWSEELRAHIRTRGWGWVNAVDRHGAGESLADRLGVQSTPAFYVVDGQGNVVSRPSSLAQVEAELGR